MGSKKLLGTLFFLFLLSEPAILAETEKHFFSSEYTEEEDAYHQTQTLFVTITAYSSTPDQTDDSPFIMASGNWVYDGAIAANFLPMGTKVMLPELYGEKIFTVEDRMHKRFSDRVDVWMETKEEAIQFGKRRVAMQIL